MKVLVVDDELPIVEVICYNLRKGGVPDLQRHGCRVLH
jgi:hypothetical protein